MTPPQLGPIHDDDAFLDALGGRRDLEGPHDELSELLQGWVASIDADPIQSDSEPIETKRRRLAPLTATAGVAVLTLSISSMAAAVTGSNVPVLSQLGQAAAKAFGGADNATADLDGGSDGKLGAADPTSSSKSVVAPSGSASPTSLPAIPKTSGDQGVSRSQSQQATQTPQARPTSSARSTHAGTSPKSSSSSTRSTSATSSSPTSATSSTPTSSAPTSSTATSSSPTTKPSTATSSAPTSSTPTSTSTRTTRSTSGSSTVLTPSGSSRVFSQADRGTAPGAFANN
ncbi:hypothetical protein ACMYYO_12215 [Dermacoccaceae bacterium W4C1]